MEYKQYVTEHVTQIGLVKLEYTYESINGKDWTLDDLYVTVDGIQKVIPKAWSKQTSQTIIRKLCQIHV